MRRLPVIATIREAYDFTFANLGAIIGLIWLPMVIVTVAQFFVTQNYTSRVQEALAAGNPNAAGSAVLFVFLYSISALALAQRQGGAMVHFAFTGLEWRMFRTLFGVMIFLMLPYVLFSLSITRLAGGGAGSAQSLAALASLGLLAAIFYFAIRLTAVLLPVVVTEEKAVIVRAWSLTIGNFWRLLAVAAGVLGPLALGTVMVMAFLVKGALPAGSMPTPELVAAISSANLPLTSGLSFLVAPLMIGLAVSASVFSWRALSKTDISI